jgi:hypothetical protein
MMLAASREQSCPNAADTSDELQPHDLGIEVDRSFQVPDPQRYMSKLYHLTYPRRVSEGEGCYRVPISRPWAHKSAPNTRERYSRWLGKFTSAL